MVISRKYQLLNPMQTLRSFHRSLMSVEVEGAAVDTTTRTSKHYDKMKQKTVAVNS